MEIKEVAISEVKVWKKNPKIIKVKDFKRLKKQIQDLGVYKPLVCFQENGKYTTLGGNMRIRALKELGHEKVEISVVHPKSEAEKFKYAISDNDSAGIYDLEKLAEALQPMIEEIDLDVFKVNIDEPESLKSVIGEFGPSMEEDEEVIDYYKKVHILISMKIDKLKDVQDALNKIIEVDGVEYEQSSN